MTTVVRYGVDSSGRAILMSERMRAWWTDVVDALGYEPVIVQGAYMSRVPGGGADASAGYHDLGGCLDLRTWDHTGGALDKLVRVLREHGAAAWRRDRQHGGMDPHLHMVCGWDDELSQGARFQWVQYQGGRNGLDDNGPDYEWRPSPLVTTPPEKDDDMPLNADDKKWIRDAITEEVGKVAGQVLDATIVAKEELTLRRAIRELWGRK